MYRTVGMAALLSLTIAATATAQTRDDKVRDDKKKVESEGFWIYNDLDKGFAEARKTGKPMFVILRCVPCVECVKLDDDLVNQDKRVKPLLEKFVCVRLVSTNGLDLSLFQFDTDQSFAGFFFNADRTIYGRFGTRSHRTSWASDVSIDGLAKALQGALELHANYPKNKADFTGKTGPAPAVSSPEKYPMLKDKYTSKIDYEGKVAASCIHCHQIGDAHRQMLRSNREAIPEELVFSYPHPKSLGLILDPREKATVSSVEKGTPAEKAGFKEGDAIVKLGGQPLLSLADVQWVLHRTPAEGATVKAEVLRDGKTVEVEWKLDKGWRQRDDISWRASTWNMRKFVTGGMSLETLDAEARKKAEVPESGMALRAKHVGAYGEHAAAKNAGFQVGDILLSFGDKTDLQSETAWIFYALNNRKVGDKVPVTVLRNGKKMTLMLPMQ